MTATDVEIIENMPMEEYNASSGYGPDKYLRRGMLRDYLIDPDGFHDRYILRSPYAKNEFTGNASTDLGQVFESLVDGVDDYVVRPAFSLGADGAPSTKNGIRVWNSNTKFAKQWTQEQRTQGKTPITEETLGKAQYLYGKFLQDKNIASLLTICEQRQVVLRYTDQETGLRLQTRPDRIKVKRAGADIKTIHALRQWDAHVDEHAYDIQRSMACEGLNITGNAFFFLIQETSWPFRRMAHPLHPDVQETGMRRYRKACDGIAKEDWSPAPQEVKPPPMWWYAKTDNESDLMEGA